MDGGNMERVLHLMADKGASDVYLTANSPIQLKINGQLVPVSDQILTPGQPRALLAELLTPVQLEELDQTGELNLGIGIRAVGSFRLSAFKQRASIAAVIRCIPHKIPSMDTLNLPPVLSSLPPQRVCAQACRHYSLTIGNGVSGWLRNRSRVNVKRRQ